MRHFAQQENCHVKVVAPVPYFPPLNISWRWKFSQVHRHEIRDGLEVFHPRYVMTPKVGMSAYGWLMYKSVLPVIKEIQKSFNFDLIDAHYVYPDGYAAIKLGDYFKKPVVVSARGSDINQFAEIPAIRKMLRSTLQRADFCIAVCQALKDAMVEIGGSARATTVIPNGVDAHHFFPIHKELARRKLGLSDARLVLSVGQLIPRKGMDILIRAFKNLVNQSSEPLQLVIAGEGGSRPLLEALISELELEEQVKLVGNRPHAELNLYYNAADLFCLASSREGWPNVVMESLACGTPVVATNVWGTPEILVSEQLGYLTERSVEGLTGQLLRALDRSWDRSAILAHMKHHTWQRAAQSVKSVFESVLQKDKQGEYSLSS